MISLYDERNVKALINPPSTAYLNGKSFIFLLTISFSLISYKNAKNAVGIESMHCSITSSNARNGFIDNDLDKALSDSDII
jgi:hypothetical protein